MGGLTFGGLYSEVYGMSNNFLNKMTKVSKICLYNDVMIDVYRKDVMLSSYHT